MKKLPLFCRILSCLLVCALAHGLHSQESTGERAKQIADVEKQIRELQDKLKNLKEELPAPKLVAHSGLPSGDWSKMFAWRAIGPANMGGRITSLAVFEADPTTYYVGTASGGLLKTTNNGSTFEHQFDKEKTVSIGAVAVCPTDRNIVWVGTGEANPRNSVSFGDGVYLSTDGGKSWKNKGLAKTFQIGKIIVHPKDPKTVYVGALGRLYGPNEERGLYKTTDGGATWERVLFVDNKTGVLDLIMHPTNPDILIAATWERQRDEFDSFRGSAKPAPATDVYAPIKVHAPGTGLYKSVDGGQTWKKLKDGLPKAKLGRIGLDWHRVNPNLVVATIDTDKAGSGLPLSKGFLGLQSSSAKEGIRVDSVVAGGPAGKAGIVKGDIILSVDGKELKTQPQFMTFLQPKNPGDKLQVALQRGKEKKELEVTLAPRPSDDPNQRGNLGIQIDEADAGILITSVVEGGPADKALIKVGDILLTMDGQQLENTRTLLKLLGDKKIGDTVGVTYQRAKVKIEAKLVVEAPQQGEPGRPYGGRLGGQRENIQDQQGPDGDDTGGIYKSTDAGETWSRVNSLNERPFYFSVVRADPTNEKILYTLGVNLYRSTDGGKTFSNKDINKGMHADQHDFWINPKDGRHILSATDGGLYVSYDRAATWEHLNHVGLGQFYHITVDNQTPYRIYGGLQDNGSWGGPSRTLRPSGPSNPDYQNINGGDGFVCRVDLQNPDLVYAESQDGNMVRRNLKTGQSSPLRPKAQPAAGAFRFNWNTPFILSQRNSSVFYCAGNYVFRSLEHGDNAKIVSPEITRTKRGSATALAESPKNSDVLWVGTDDGAVWLTQDGCKNWVDVSDKIIDAGLPAPRWVSSIEPSRAVAGRCYVVFDAHRSNDDNPYVFITEDFGKTWKSLNGNLPLESTRVLREDLVNPDLLYLGTEFGIHASINRGQSWFKIHGGKLPTVAVHEIAQPTTAPEIVAGTHGRSLWVLDVKTLRQLKPEHFANATTLFAPHSLTRWRLDTTREGLFQTGTRSFLGQNPARQASLDFILGKNYDNVSLSITDMDGRPVRELDLGEHKGEAGFHRVVWDLSGGDPKKGAKKGGMGEKGGGMGEKFAKGVKGAKGAPALGKKGGKGPVLGGLEGTFRVHLNADGQIFSRTIVVEPDPAAKNLPADVDIDEADAAEEDRLLRRLFDRLERSIVP
jgi:photosystem II stability/assembly factor-like uncharacterized protein